MIPNINAATAGYYSVVAVNTFGTAECGGYVNILTEVPDDIDAIRNKPNEVETIGQPPQFLKTLK